MTAADPGPRDADLDRKWRNISAIAVTGILAVGIICGFILLPVIQGYQAGIDAYTAICRALGIEPGSPLARQPPPASPGKPVSRVAWTENVLRGLDVPDPQSGRQVAEEACTPCHGIDGVSTDPTQFPNMAGQTAAAIYKQLNDYRSGARKNELMQDVASKLSLEQLVAVSAYYAQLEPLRWDQTWVQVATPAATQLALQGDARRGLPACQSCHSPRAGGPIETPVLFGQTREYFTGQMNAYKRDERTNDVYARMRSIAKKLTESEVAQLAQFYWERR